MQIQKGFCKILKDSRDITIFVRPPFPPKFLAFHSALPIDVYLPFPAILHYLSSSLLSTYKLSYVSIRKPRCMLDVDCRILPSPAESMQRGLPTITEGYSLWFLFSPIRSFLWLPKSLPNRQFKFATVDHKLKILT